MITVTINEKKVTLEKSVTILDAARGAGIEIPTLCHNDILEPYGGCRLCLVEVEKVPKLQTSCTQFVTDGMVIRTETERVVEARRSVLEFLLINHPLDCPYCDKAGECSLQDLAMKYGPATGRFAEGKRKHPESFDDPLIVRNMERCILCLQCVRMCDDVQGASAICITNRSSKAFVEPFSGKRYDCEYCGNCLTVCPVGAITSRLHRHGYRPWQIDKEVETICSYCGVGCSLTLQVRGNTIVRSIPKVGYGLNKGLLCNKGRFGYDYINSKRRLDAPLIRKDGDLRAVSWTEAITFTAQRLKEIKERYGGGAIGGIVSGRATNEDAYVFQKFLRGVIGTNNIDSSAGLAYGPAQKFFEKIFGQGITANPLYGIENSDGVVVIGGDPTAVNPVLGLHIRDAHQKGVPVIVIGHAQGLERFSRLQLYVGPPGETVMLAALVSELRDKKPFSGERPLFESMIRSFQSVPLSEISALNNGDHKKFSALMDTLSTMTNPSLIVGRNTIQANHGDMNLLFLAALAYLLNGRIYILSELPNEQGLLDMGCQPEMLPCGRPLALDTFRRRCEQMMGVAIPATTGLTYVEMIEASQAGRVKALHVMGENIAGVLPDTKYVKSALNNLELLIVHDHFLTETAQMADVVLPGLSWAEKDGSYTNLERRIQLTRKAVEGRGLGEWKAIAEISKVLGFEMDYVNAEDIFSEIAEVSLLYRDISYNDLGSGKCMWPYKGGLLRHDAHIEGVGIPDVRSLLKKAEQNVIVACRDVSLFHSENSTGYSTALQTVAHEPYVRISTLLAERLSVNSGEYVTVSSGAGSVTLSVQIDPSLPGGVILIPSYEERGIFELLPWNINPVIKVAALDGTGVTLERFRA